MERTDSMGDGAGRRVAPAIKCAVVILTMSLLVGCADWNDPRRGGIPADDPTAHPSASAPSTSNDPWTGGHRRPAIPLPSGSVAIEQWGRDTLPEGEGLTVLQSFFPLGRYGTSSSSAQGLPAGTYRISMACTGAGRVNFALAARSDSLPEKYLVLADIDCSTAATRVVVLPVKSDVTVTGASRGRPAVAGYRVSRI